MRSVSRLVSLFAFAFWVATCVAEPIQVVRVIDGDTFEAAGGFRVRLLGIDAPELRQPGGVEAKRALEALVANQVVDLQSSRRGAWQRIDALVVREGVGVNQMMIAWGLAWVEPRYVLARDRASWNTIERVARDRRIGIWAGVNLPPWEWRKGRR